ncbi:MAG: amino acid adenylation domain-containing protein, partial [Cyclobacteriaceae bacterium]
MRSFIRKLIKLNVDVDLVDGQLQLDIPEGLDATEIIEEIRERKDELVAFLQGSLDEEAYDSIQPAPIRDYYVMSSAQRRMYFQYQFDKSATTYNMPQVVRIEGSVDTDRLRNAFEQLVNRHESLRTRFIEHEGETVQQVMPSAAFELERYSCHEKHVGDIISTFVRPFNLSEGSLVRAGLVTLEDNNDYLLMVDMHHIISDGVSQSILVSDFLSLYDGDELPVVHLQYKDYAEWQQSDQQQSEMGKYKAYWTTEFAEEPEVLNLPTDHSRPAVKSYKGSGYSFVIGSKETHGLKELTSHEGGTMYITLLTLFNVLLSKLGNSEDIVVGTPVAGRQHADLEQIIGMFVNTLPLRNYPSGDKTFRSFLEEVRQRSLTAFEHQSFQYEELIDHLKLGRDTSRNPLFDVMFTYQTFEDGQREPKGLKLSAYGNENPISKFDMILGAGETGDQISFSFEYSTDLFEESTIEQFAEYFTRLISDVVSSPDKLLKDLNILSAEEKDELLHRFNDTATAYPSQESLATLFEQKAAGSPEDTAIVFRGTTVSYKGLNERANRFARHLVESYQVAEGSVVGIVFDRSPEMIVAMLGILKAGGAYLPIDSGHPEDRIGYMLKDSGASAFIYHNEVYKGEYSLPGEIFDETTYSSFSGENMVCRSTGDSVAYIIYTSGTTGTPKGTVIRQRSVTRVVRDTNYIELQANDRILQLSNYAFDGSVFDIYGAMLNGASLVLAEKELISDLEKLGDFIREESITVFFVTTALFNVLTDEKLDCLKGVRKIMFGGEQVSVGHVEKALEVLGSDTLIHVYGPTESTVFATWYAIRGIEEGSETIPIGGPLANTRLYVLDSRGQLLPKGVAGELFISGDGLADGYLNNEELTREKFVPNPYEAGGQMYRTGDLVRWLDSGHIEFIGRIDSQVKIRGFRIELGGIEKVLDDSSMIRESVVLAKERDGNRYLAAYVVPEEGFILDALRTYLGDRLPDYMIPD